MPARGILSGIFPENQSSMNELLVLGHVTVRFGGIAALTEVSLTVERAELVALVGPNGAGKSTVLNAVCGIVKSTGTITLNERRIDGLPSSEVAAAGIGRSFQDAPLIGDLSVLENVMCGAHRRLSYTMLDQIVRPRLTIRRERNCQNRAMQLLDFVGLSGSKDTPAKSLSYGARKRLDLARAMVAGPEVLLLDEPSSGLDEAERDALMTILETLRLDRAVTVIFVEHHMDIVRHIATQVVVLKAGRVHMSGEPREVLESRQFKETILGARPDVAPDVP